MKMKTKTLVLSITTLLFGILFSACSKDDTPSMSINKSEITLTRNQDESIIVTPNASGCLFDSDNILIASVSTEGKVTGITVGTTFITVTNSLQGFTAKCKVAVDPVYNTLKEPYLDFGALKSKVKTNETRTLVSETSTGLIYEGENSNINYIIYLFDSLGNMTGAGVIFPISKMDTIVNFLAERYVPIGYDDGFGIFMSNDEKMIVGITEYNTSYIMAVYTEKSTTKSSESAIENQMVDLVSNFFNRN